MIDFPDFNAPCRDSVSEAKKAAMGAVNSFIREELKSIEENGKSEESRVQAGLARRHNDMNSALGEILHFADPQRDIPIETVKAASDVLEKALTELTAFLNSNPIPEKTKTVI